GLLAAGASLMVFLALYPLGRTPSARRRQRTLLLVPLLIGGVAFVVWSASSDRGASTLLVRADFWRTAVRIVADHPLLGTGPDTFYAFYPTYRPVESALVYTGVESSAHNLLLHHAVGSGLLGAGLFLVLIGMAFLFALRGPRQPSKAEAGEDQTNGPGSALRPRLLATFSAVLAGYLVQGMFSVDLPPLALVGWVAMGGIAALADPKLAGQPAGLPVDHGPGKPTKVNAGSRRSTRRTGSALLAGLMALLILVGIRPFLADMRARSAVSSSDLQERVSLFRQAQELNPLEGEYHYMAGRTLWRFGANATDDNSKRQLYDAALSQHRRADDLRPRQVRYLVEIARLESAVAQELDAARFSSADRAWQAVTRLDPTDYRWHKMRARLLGAWADATGNNQQVRQAQITELRRSIQIARGQPDAWARLVLALRALGRPDEAAEVQGSFFGPGMADVQLQSLVQDDPVPPVPSAPPAEPDRPAARFGLAAVVAAAGVFLWLLLSRLVGASLDGQEARRAVPRTPLFELVAAAGVLSAAVASPYLAPLLGLESTDVERRELVLHLIPAVALVALGIWCAGSNRIRPAAFRRAVAALFVAAALSVVPHVPALLDGGQSDIARGLLHVAPGLLVLALLTQARLPVEPRRSDAARLAVDQ
ncbi:MAG TPA: O-antigen ligase family protein, partial [Actinomycetota bacterium]|nr:O-antigen ligase family protein [Actinomycetota bacterium]